MNLVFTIVIVQLIFVVVVNATSGSSNDVADPDTVKLLRMQLPDDFYEDDDDDDDGDHDAGGGLLFDNEAIANWKLGLNGSTPKIQCHSCEPPDCSHPTICVGAVRCYTSHVRDTDGTEKKSKGEIKIESHFRASMREFAFPTCVLSLCELQKIEYATKLKCARMHFRETLIIAGSLKRAFSTLVFSYVLGSFYCRSCICRCRCSCMLGIR